MLFAKDDNFRSAPLDVVFEFRKEGLAFFRRHKSAIDIERAAVEKLEAFFAFGRVKKVEGHFRFL